MAQDTRNGLETEQNWTMSDVIGLDSVTGEADQLMDDLFSDINTILEDGQQLPDSTKSPDYVSLESVVVPPIHLPTPPPVQQTASSSSNTPLSSQTTPPTLTPRRKRLTPDKFLFGFACLTFLGVVGWLISQNQLEFFDTKFLEQRMERETPQLSESDAEFIEYMKRSLRAINRQVQVAQPPSEPPAPPAPPTAATTPPGANSQVPTVLERIYIPVYPPDSPQTPTPSQSPVASPQPEPALQIPAPPPQPTARTVPSVPVSPPPPPQPEPAIPTPEHTLVGLLELGERSAALFNIEGVTQRVRVGEAIGSSGWTLVSIANQKAVIRRNGEVRSIFVGQKL
jgi:hypothetical protein